ncbi:MAG: FUSC family membrane protein, partial [Solirubrobacteraceae bacterium]
MLTRARQSSTPESEPAALTSAVRAAGRFDRHLISFTGGLLAAIPVVAVLGIPIAAGDPVAGVTMGAGAMLVGIAWRTSGGRPPVALMATDATLMALSTFVGSVTGSIGWLHLIVLAMWALSAGLLVSLGQRGAIVGNQAVIALVVFGRFSGPASQALGLAGLVFAGGLAQVLFQAIIRWPSPLRVQRQATAAAYRELARLASDAATASALPAATALDEAQGDLASPSLFGDSALLTLRSLVDEGHRIRVQLSAIHGLIRQQRSTGADADDPSAAGSERALEQASEALALAADAIEGDETATEALDARVGELTALVAALGPTELTPRANA